MADIVEIWPDPRIAEMEAEIADLRARIAAAYHAVTELAASPLHGRAFAELNRIADGLRPHKGESHG